MVEEYKKLELKIVEKLISGEQKQIDAAVKELSNSKRLFSLTRAAVNRSGGKEADVEDTFQESIASLMKNVIKGDFLNKSTLSTYFSSICKKTYLKRRPKFSTVELKEGPEKSIANQEISLLQEERNEEIRNLAMKILDMVGEPCKSILMFRNEGFDYETILSRMKDRYTSSDAIKNEAARCRKKLRKVIEENPDLEKKYKELLG